MQAAHDLSFLYSEFGARIYRSLRRMTRDDVLAEDLTQETFLRAAMHLDTFRGEGAPAGWLQRIATNLLRDHLRQRKSRQQLLAEVDGNGTEPRALLSEVADPGPSIPEIVERQAVTQCVRDCICTLPGPYRDALLLHAVEDKPVEECAALLGCTTGTVKVRLHRGRRLFEKVAAEQCEVSTAAHGGAVSCLPKGR